MPCFNCSYLQAAIQRTMISTWAIELFLDKLNTLEDSATNSNNTVAQESMKSETETVRLEFQDFIKKHKVYLNQIKLMVERLGSSDNIRSYQLTRSRIRIAILCHEYQRPQVHLELLDKSGRLGPSGPGSTEPNVAGCLL
jgi:hypothetical protein